MLQLVAGSQRVSAATTAMIFCNGDMGGVNGLTPSQINDGLVVGRNYTLQSTTNLAVIVWSNETNFVASQVTAVFTNFSDDAQEFFRAISY